MISDSFLIPLIAGLAGILLGCTLLLNGSSATGKGLTFRFILGLYLIFVSTLACIPRFYPEGMGALGILEKVGERKGTRIFANASDPREDKSIITLVQGFQQEFFQELFGLAEIPECPVNILVIRSGGSSLGTLALSQLGFGYYGNSLFTGPTVVQPENSGLGSLTHHLVYRYLSCAADKEIPPWLSVTLATYYEKFLAFEKDDGIFLSGGYRSNWRTPILGSYFRQVKISRLISDGGDQNAQQSFAVYLNFRGWLKTFIREITHAALPPEKVLEQVTGKSLTSLEEDWLSWFEKESHLVPMVEASSVLEKGGFECLDGSLKDFVWDKEKNLWLAVSHSGNSLISQSLVSRCQ